MMYKIYSLHDSQREVRHMTTVRRDKKTWRREDMHPSKIVDKWTLESSIYHSGLNFH